MPKKMGANTKAVEAKTRKETAKKAKEEAAERQREDEFWRDDDKHVNRKLERQQQRDQKKQEAQQRKAQNRAAYEEELKSVATATASNSAKNLAKVTRSQIASFVEKKQKQEAVAEETKKPTMTHLDVPLVENVNRLTIDGDEARNVDEAIAILSTTEPELDRHPERRVRAAWTAYEERHLPRLKLEHPSLRLSQLKEMLRKEFNKSPENPLNQAAAGGRPSKS